MKQERGLMSTPAARNQGAMEMFREFNSSSSSSRVVQREINAPLVTRQPVGTFVLPTCCRCQRETEGAGAAARSQRPFLLSCPVPVGSRNFSASDEQNFSQTGLGIKLGFISTQTQLDASDIWCT